MFHGFPPALSSCGSEFDIRYTLSDLPDFGSVRPFLVDFTAPFTAKLGSDAAQYQNAKDPTVWTHLAWASGRLLSSIGRIRQGIITLSKARRTYSPRNRRRWRLRDWDCSRLSCYAVERLMPAHTFSVQIGENPLRIISLLELRIPRLVVDAPKL
jgi:hypothetical protein